MPDTPKPGCVTCLTPGAPSHDPQPGCQHLKDGITVVHCSCAACF